VIGAQTVRDGGRHERALLLVGISAGSLAAPAAASMDGVGWARVRRVAHRGGAVAGPPVIPAWAQDAGLAALLMSVHLSARDGWVPADATGWKRLWKGVGLVLLVLGQNANRMGAPVVGATFAARFKRWHRAVTS